MRALCAIAALSSIACHTGTRVRVVAAKPRALHDFSTVRIADARARLECLPDPAAKGPPRILAETTTDETGEGMLEHSQTAERDCAIWVEADGYQSRFFLLEDVCVNRNRPCHHGVVLAEMLRSGRWNYDDATEIATQIEQQCFADPSWLTEEKPTPRIMVRTTINKTDEHLDLHPLVDPSLKSLLDRGLAVVLEHRTARDAPYDFGLILHMTSITEQQEETILRSYKAQLQIARPDGEVVCIADATVRKMSIAKKATW